MRKTSRALLGILALVVGAPLVAYVAYDLLRFQPHRGQIATLVSRASPHEQAPPAHISGLLHASLGQGTAAYASKLLMAELHILPERQSMLHWHLHSTLWWSLVALHLSESERVTVILALAPTGTERRGVANTAESLFGQPLPGLSLEQAATVIALTKAPGFAQRPERIKALAENLLSIYQARIQPSVPPDVPTSAAAPLQPGRG